MTNLTPAQIGQYAAAAGFKGTALRNAVAVALAESGGNPRAVGVNSDRWHSRDRGLWQINDHWHPEVSDAEAFNPASAARHAYRISSGGKSWSAWSTWKNGTAQAQLGRAQLGANQAAGGGVVPAAYTATPAGFDPGDLTLPGLIGNLVGGAASGGLPGLGGAVVDMFKAPVVILVKTAAWVADPHNWGRVVMVQAGAVGVLIGLALVAKSGAAGDGAKGLADSVSGAAKTAGEVGVMALTKKPA